MWLASLANVAPLVGFSGRVLEMVEALVVIEFAGELDQPLVGGGIKIARCVVVPTRPAARS